ncbi:sensor histidine kinase [Paenibacillus lentus]|uniref:histidine kinase n=1 Tax=Paenibacillus lentus TaxID=1338368 RepID=A0A3S8RSZ0_9BACL|nr:sensor histidine kinase [Paenibacillus lentus]AZK46101.1 sensor histidine kinase [Paenibacillus lentus]
MGKFRGVFREAGIYHKMLVLITLLMIVSFSLYWIALKYVTSLYDRQMYERTSQVLNSSALGIENQLREQEELSFRVFSDEQLQQSLAHLKVDGATAYQKAIQRKKIMDRLTAIAGSEKFVYSIMVIDREHQALIGGNRAGMAQELQTELTSIAESADGSNVWYVGSDRSLYAVRQIKSYSGTTFPRDNLGTLIIRFRKERIIEDFVQSGGDDSHLIITDGSKIIYPDHPLISEAEIAAELMRSESYGLTTVGENRYFFTRVRSSDLGWTYLNMTPFNSMFRTISFVKELVTIIFILILFIGIAFGVKLSRSITRPIEQLIKKMRKIEKGDLDNLEEQSLGEVPKTSQTEVEHLQRTFKMMIQRIRELINQNYAKQLVIRESELKALQAQINPHFLYNTLDSINWLAKVNGQKQISQMVESLGFLLRSSLDDGTSLVTLKSELEIIRSYVTIQRIRFEERLDFELEVPDEYLDALIPKMTLQPLLENAIHYALEPKIDPCHIRIIVEKLTEKHGALNIRVEDDGPGMTADFITELRGGRVQTRGKGIGLSNIEERIKLTFGSEWGIRIESEPNVRTAIHVRIPYRQGEEEDV